MNKDAIDVLAQEIADLGAGVLVDEFLAALGVVVVQALCQLAPQERMPATVGWIAVLTADMVNDYKTRLPRAN